MADTCKKSPRTSALLGTGHPEEFSVTKETCNVASFDTLQPPSEEVSTVNIDENRLVIWNFYKPCVKDSEANAMHVGCVNIVKDQIDFMFVSQFSISD